VIPAQETAAKDRRKVEQGVPFGDLKGEGASRNGRFDIPRGELQGGIV